MAWSIKQLTAVSALLATVDAAAIFPRQTTSNTASCPGYKASNVQKKGLWVTGADLNLAGAACNVYGTDLDNLKLSVEYQTPERLHVKIYDAAEQVYQVPESVLPRPKDEQVSPAQSDLEFSMTEAPFSFAVKRKSTGETLFDTAGHPMLFESQYVGLRTSLPQDPNIYGLGESTDSFRLPTTNLTRTLWSRDAYGTPIDTNLYGNHPVYYDHRGANGTHGVFLLNSNGMDIVIDQDSAGQYLEYRTLGGVLDFYFLSGPGPKEVAKQYAETIGKPAMMPYWGLGFHNCRYGYRDIYEVAEVIANYSAANIPLETQWNDIDYMDLRKVFTLDPLRYNKTLVREVVSYLHDHNQHYVMMVDPAVAYQDYPPFNNGVEKDAFMKFANGSVYKGVVWPGVTAFPDWFAPNTQDYWNGEFDSFFNPEDGVDIDALWIDMNEPSNFCDFPCNNPEQFAISNNDPPAPPAVRLSSPRPIPGFGPDFQPKCVATVFFDCYAQTYYGENIFILGNTSTLGDGSAINAAPMNANHYPDWQATIQFPVNTTISYQYIRKESDGSYIYEAQNRTLHTGDCTGGTQDVKDTITTSSGPHKRSEKVVESVVAPVAEYTVSEVKRDNTGSMKGLPNRNLLSPPYHIRNAAGALSEKTINTDLVHANGLVEYDTHNLYGTMMSSTSRGAMLSRRPSVRPLVITRSTFAGAGAHVGHWLGDSFTDWDHYRWSIAGIQEFAALFQVPMVGSDICGFAGTTTDNLCSRWVFIGAFSPFFRDHSSLGDPPHELYVSEQIAAAGRAAIDIRYRLLDYAYTAMWKQTQTGEPMLNPMFFEYPSDPHTAQLQYQFFYGDSIMVAPVTDQDSTSVDVYFPNDQFYDFFTGAPVASHGTTVTLNNVAFDTIPLYFKGGSIVPMRVESANTTTELRKQDFVVVIAPDTHGRASGMLYLDDGDSLVQQSTSEITFTYENGRFGMNGKFDHNPGEVVIAQVVVLGAQAAGRGGKYDAANKKATYDVNVPLTHPYSAEF